MSELKELMGEYEAAIDEMNVWYKMYKSISIVRDLSESKQLEDVKYAEEIRVLVENINIVKRHTRPSATNRQGGIVEGEAPINWANVMVMCNKCVKPVRIKMQRLEDGKKVRICRECNEIMDA